MSKLIDRMTGGCWDCGYLSMTGNTFVKEAVCLHREVQQSLLAQRKRFIKNVDHQDKCPFKEAELDMDKRGEPRQAFLVTVSMAVRADREAEEADPEKEPIARQGSLF